MKSYILKIDKRLTNIMSTIQDSNTVASDSSLEGYNYYEDDNIFVFLDGHIFSDDKKLTFDKLVETIRSPGFEQQISKSSNINISGDFCLCIVLKKESKTLLFRDPMGHKVAYYYYEQDILYISNDGNKLYSLLPRKYANLTYIFKYLLYQTPGYMEHMETPVQACFKCLAGHYASFQVSSNNEIYGYQKKYYDINDIAVNYDITENEAISFFEESIYKSFSEYRQFLSEGAALGISGGLDSTLLCSFIKRIGLKETIKYFNYSIQDDESGFSEDRYIGIVRDTFGIDINRFLFEEKVPTLFNGNRSILEAEPGSLSSHNNMRLILEKINEIGCNKIIFGYVESIFRNTNDLVIKMKEYNELPLLLQIKHSKHYEKNKYRILQDRLLHSLPENCSARVTGFCYDHASILSHNLHSYYAGNCKGTLYDKFCSNSIQEMKYENIMSPNYECLANFQYSLWGIGSICPLHSTHMLKFAISTPSFLFHGDPKYFIKKHTGLPPELLKRPKISVSTSNVYKGAIPFAAKYLHSPMALEECINIDNFRQLCQRILLGTFSGFDFRRFYSVVSLENFILENNLSINL